MKIIYIYNNGQKRKIVIYLKYFYGNITIHISKLLKMYTLITVS